MSSEFESATYIASSLLPLTPIGFDIDEVAKPINLPDDPVMSPMVAIGKGTKDAWPKPGQRTLDKVVVGNDFSFRSKSLSVLG